MNPNPALKISMVKKALFLMLALGSTPALAGAKECQSAYAAKDYTQAFQICQEPAQNGDRGSQFNLAYMLENGLGTSKDLAAAFGWYSKAAEKGEPSSQNNLGLMYQNGRGTTRDLEKARFWYQKAADQGNATAMTNLGIFYMNGEGGPQDDQKAVQLFLQAALKNNSWAQNLLGDMYFYGRGITMSDTEAIFWYRKAADQGHTTAMLNLGNMYLNGRGVAKNLTEAQNWFEKSARAGNKAAQVQLDQLKKAQEQPETVPDTLFEEVEVQVVGPREGSKVRGKTAVVTVRLSSPVTGFVPFVLVNGDEVEAKPSMDLSGRVSLFTLSIPLPEDAEEYRLEIGGAPTDTYQVIAAFLTLLPE